MSKARQARKARQKERAKQRAEEELLPAAPPEDTPIEEEVIEKDTEEKHLVETVPGPTSFEELDVMREEQDKLWKVQDITWDARNIVRNIFADSDKDTSAKVSAIKKMADGFGKKVSDIMGSKKDFGLNPDGEFDPTIAEVELMYRTVSGGNPITKAFENAISLLSNAENLEDEQFAHITKDGERLLPLHDAPHIEKALAFILTNLKYKGTHAELAEEVRSKVLAVARKQGYGMPSDKNKMGIIVQKGLDNTWRWMGWVSNNFIDREKDILTEKAHKEYVEFLNEHPEHAPEFRIWHVKGTARESKADWWSYTNGFLMMSGPLTETEAKSLLIASEKEDLGMSHGFYPIMRNPANAKEIEMYRTFEVSDLPLRFAANPFTNIEALSKEAQMSNDLNKKDHLLNFMDEDAVNLLLETTKQAQESLVEAGVINKEDDTETKPVETEGDPAPDEETPSGEEDTQEDTPENKALEQLVKAIGEAYDLNSLSEWAKEVNTTLELIPDIHALLQTAQKTKDEAIAEAITPPLANTFGWSRPSQSKDTEVDETDPDDAALVKSGPGGNGWYANSAVGGK